MKTRFQEGYLRECSNMYLTILKPDDPKRLQCGYTYLVTSGAFSHTAYKTKAGMRYWLHKTGIKIGRRCRHLYRTHRLEGAYGVNLLLIPRADFDAQFARLPQCYQLDNGDYTEGRIEKTEGGNIIHLLNPNVKEREVFDYFRTNKMVG